MTFRSSITPLPTKAHGVARDRLLLIKALLTEDVVARERQLERLLAAEDQPTLWRDTFVELLLSMGDADDEVMLRELLKLLGLHRALATEACDARL